MYLTLNLDGSVESIKSTYTPGSLEVSSEAATLVANTRKTPAIKPRTDLPEKYYTIEDGEVVEKTNTAKEIPLVADTDKPRYGKFDEAVVMTSMADKLLERIATVSVKTALRSGYTIGVAYPEAVLAAAMEQIDPDVELYNAVIAASTLADVAKAAMARADRKMPEPVEAKPLPRVKEEKRTPRKSKAG